VPFCHASSSTFVFWRPVDTPKYPMPERLRLSLGFPRHTFHCLMVPFFHPLSLSPSGPNSFPWQNSTPWNFPVAFSAPSQRSILQQILLLALLQRHLFFWEVPHSPLYLNHRWCVVSGSLFPRNKVCPPISRLSSPRTFFLPHSSFTTDVIFSQLNPPPLLLFPLLPILDPVLSKTSNRLQMFPPSLVCQSRLLFFCDLIGSLLYVVPSRTHSAPPPPLKLQPYPLTAYTSLTLPVLPPQRIVSTLVHTFFPIPTPPPCHF